jgi:CheY-like chemotaxis protein
MLTKDRTRKSPEGEAMASGCYEVSETGVGHAVSFCSEEHGASRTVLILEDQDFVREVTGEVLRSVGYRVFTAKNAMEAGRLYEMYGSRVDLLIADIVLSGESGWSFARRMREQFGTRILLMSGYAEQIALPRSEPVLAKPFSQEQLLRRVGQMLDDGLCEDQPAGFRRVCAGA